MELKRKIEALISPLTVELENSFAEAETLLKSKQSEYQELSIAYTELLGEVTSTKDKFEKEKQDIKRAFDEIESESLTLDNEKDVFYSEAQKINESLILKRDEIELLNKEITERKAELKTVEVLTKQKDILTSDLARVNSELTTKGTLIKEAEGKLELAIAATNKEIDRLSTLNAEVEQSLADRTIKVISREQAADAKEKKLNEKEEDLKTIEARWKKLYESKGAGFKI